MDKPWKVVLAFVGVFIAGAVFGGFFAVGIGRQVWQTESVAARPAPLQVATTPPPTAVPAAAPQPQPAKPAPQPAPQPALPPPHSVQAAQLMRQVTSKLNLTATQKSQIAPLIQRAVEDFWRQQQNFSRENAFILERLKQDIGKELTSEQRAQLNDLWLKALEVTRQRQAEAQAQRQAVKSGEPTSGAPAAKAPAPAPESGGAKLPAPEAATKTPSIPAAKPAGDAK
jgi:hypothetical protein